MVDIQKAIKLLLDTGKVDMGARRARNHALRGTAKAIFIAENCPQDLKGEIIENCKKSNIHCKEIAFSSLELGSICGKPFPVSALSVIDAGNSNIINIVAGAVGEEEEETPKETPEETLEEVKETKEMTEIPKESEQKEWKKRKEKKKSAQQEAPTEAPTEEPVAEEKSEGNAEEKKE